MERVEYFIFLFTFCLIGTATTRFITDHQRQENQELVEDEIDWINDPQFPVSDRKTFTQGFLNLFF